MERKEQAFETITKQPIYSLYITVLWQYDIIQYLISISFKWKFYLKKGRSFNFIVCRALYADRTATSYLERLDQRTVINGTAVLRIRHEGGCVGIGLMKYS